MPSPLDAGDEPLLVGGYLAIKDQGAWPKRADGLGQLGEAGGQILGVPAHQPDAIAVLVGEHAVAVDRFLVEPPLVVEGLRHQGGVHRGNGGGHQIQCCAAGS
jgi:hypothetical protein